MSSKVKSFLKYFLITLLVILCIWYAFKDIDIVKLWDIILNVNYIWVLISIPIMMLSHWVRALRWKTMLNPIMKVHSVWNLFSAVMIGYAVNNIIPRGGEFLRPYIFARREKVSFSSSFATIIVERVLDVLVLLMMLGGVSLVFSEQLRTALPNIHLEKIVYPTLILVAALLLCFYPPFIKFLLRFFLKPLNLKLYEKLTITFDKFVLGIEIIKKPSQYFRLTVESLLIWFLYTIPMYLMFFCFKFQSTLHLGFDDAILLIVISGIAFTIAPTPGAIGVFHVIIQGTLMKLYGISSEEALAYATVNHAVGYFVQLIPGGLFFLRENIKKIPKSETDLQVEAT